MPVAGRRCGDPVRGVVAHARASRDGVVAGRAVCGVSPAACAVPRRHPAAQRCGLGADQRVVLRVLVAADAVGVRCGGRWARAAQGGHRSALSAFHVVVRDRGGQCAAASAHLHRPGGDRRGVDAGCAAAGRVRQQPVVLRPGSDQAADQRAWPVHAAGAGPGRPPQRRAGAVQPQVRPDPGQPVALPVAGAGPAPCLGLGRRCGGGRGGVGAGGFAGVVDHLRRDRAAVRLAVTGWPSSAGSGADRRAAGGRRGGGGAAGASRSSAPPWPSATASRASTRPCPGVRRSGARRCA